jgi:mono/diheme cytochrome c family protein
MDQARAPYRGRFMGRTRSFIAFLLVCLAILSAGCDTQLPGKPDPKDKPIPVEEVLAFDKLYSRNCAGCHGADGVNGPAPPLNDPLFRAIVPKDELQHVLEQGRKQETTKTSMAPFAHSNGGPLSAAQIQVLVHEIKGVPYRIARGTADGKAMVEAATSEAGLVPQWGAVSSAQTSVPPYALPKTSGNAERGVKLFARACASCHGSNGEGVSGDGKLSNIINDTAFLALISDQEIRRIIITGRPDLKMPDYAQRTERPDDFQPLTSAEIADLGALLASWRNEKSVAGR